MVRLLDLAKQLELGEAVGLGVAVVLVSGAGLSGRCAERPAASPVHDRRPGGNGDAQIPCDAQGSAARLNRAKARQGRPQSRRSGNLRAEIVCVFVDEIRARRTSWCHCLPTPDEHRVQSREVGPGERASVGDVVAILDDARAGVDGRYRRISRNVERACGAGPAPAVKIRGAQDERPRDRLAVCNGRRRTEQAQQCAERKSASVAEEHGYETGGDGFHKTKWLQFAAERWKSLGLTALLT